MEVMADAVGTTTTFGVRASSAIGAKSRVATYAASRISGATHSVLLYISRVWPSGVALATTSPGTTPAGRLSTDTGWPRGPAIPCATRREMRSFPPPASDVTTRTGWVG